MSRILAHESQDRRKDGPPLLNPFVRLGRLRIDALFWSKLGDAYARLAFRARDAALWCWARSASICDDYERRVRRYARHRARRDAQDAEAWGAVEREIRAVLDRRDEAHAQDP